MDYKAETREVNGQKVKYHPVRLLKGYFPADPVWPHLPNQKETPVKAKRGEVIFLPVEEVRTILALGIAERADEIPL